MFLCDLHTLIGLSSYQSPRAAPFHLPPASFPAALLPLPLSLLPNLPCFLLCKALLSSTFFAFSSAFLTFICLGISAALACSRPSSLPSLSLPAPLLLFIWARTCRRRAHTLDTHTHTGEFTIFISLCVCESRVGSLVCSRVGEGTLNRNCDREVRRQQTLFLPAHST